MAVVSKSCMSEPVAAVLAPGPLACPGELSEALARAESALFARTAFLVNMSHEIRVPLNCMLGMARLTHEASPAQQRNYIEKIEQSGRHMLRIVNEILDFSKIDAGRLDVERVPFDVKQTLADAAAGFAGLARENNLDFDLVLDPLLPTLVLGDPLRLSQILYNYIDNAIKFTRHGHVSVSARLLEPVAAGLGLRVEVNDSGIGLAPDKKACLFQPYQQADIAGGRSFGGTGLGLAICRQLAQLMGGTVGVESEPGVGSMFWFEINLGQAEPGQCAVAASTADQMQVERAMASLRGCQVLVAEDNPLNQELVRLLLEKSGATVMVAANGHEALAALALASFDCVLMDVSMPLMDGCEAARQIRGNPALAKLPLIAMTANAFTSDRERCLAAGIDDFLIKPFEVEQFYLTLAHWIGSLPAAFQPVGQVDPVRGANWDGLAVLATLVDNDAETMARLMRLFLDNAHSAIEQMQLAVADNDQPRLAAQGRRLSLAARAVGAGAFADACLVIEQRALHGEPGTAKLVEALGPLFAQQLAFPPDFPTQNPNAKS